MTGVHLIATNEGQTQKVMGPEPHHFLVESIIKSNLVKLKLKVASKHAVLPFLGEYADPPRLVSATKLGLSLNTLTLALMPPSSCFTSLCCWIPAYCLIH